MTTVHVIVALAVVVYLLVRLGKWLGLNDAGFRDSDDIERDKGND